MDGDYEVVLSGKITGDPEYRRRFAELLVRVRCRWHGAKVWNPGELEDGREYLWYMRRCLDVIMNRCRPGARIVRMRGWHRSAGAVAEWAVARCFGLEVVDERDV